MLYMLSLRHNLMFTNV